MQINSFLDNSLTRVYDQKPQRINDVNQKAENNEDKKLQNLSPAQKAQLIKLQAKDAEVRQHEAAHIAAGGGVVKGGANFTYQKGPDDNLYAIGGEVPIDIAEEAHPQDTIAKMQIVRSAALAPKDPSSTDYQVASTATMIEMKARLELAQENKEALQKEGLQKYANNEDINATFNQYA